MASLFALIGLAGAGMVAAQAPEAAPGACVTLTDAIASNGLTSLRKAVISVLGDTGAESLATIAQSPIELTDDMKVTIFAPDNAAFSSADLPEGGVLVEVLLGHVIEAYLPSADILADFADMPGDIPLPTYADPMVTASMIGSDIYVAAEGQAPPGAKVTQTDIMTCVGVIHVIDALLLPGDAMAPGPAALAPIPVADMPVSIGPISDSAPAPVDTMLPGIDSTAPLGAPGDESATRNATVGAAPESAGASHMVVGVAASAMAALFALLA